MLKKPTDEKPRGLEIPASMMVTDHAYLSAGDTPYADGDRPYTGCFICGRSRKEHAA